MKITPTMKREQRNSGYASPVFHPKKWPGWSAYPYHSTAVPIRKVRMPRHMATAEQEREHWPQVVKFWKQVAREMLQPLAVLEIKR